MYCHNDDDKYFQVFIANVQTLICAQSQQHANRTTHTLEVKSYSLSTSISHKHYILAYVYTELFCISTVSFCLFVVLG